MTEQRSRSTAGARRRALAAALGFATGASLLAAVPAGAFDASTNTAPGDSTMASNDSFGAFGAQVVAADADGDGVTDLLVVNDNQSAGDGSVLSIYLGEAATPFSEFPLYNDLSFTDGRDPDIYVSGISAGAGRGLVVGDFDGDGATQLAITVDDTVQVFDTPAPGGYDIFFLSTSTIPSLSGVDAVAAVAGDVDGDGNDDLVIGWADDQVTVHPSASEFPITSITGPDTTGFGRSLALGNFVDLASGPLDLAIGAPLATDAVSGEGIVWAIADLATAVSFVSIPGDHDVRLVGGQTDAALGTAILVDDVNGDGAADLVTGAPGGFSATGYVSYALGPVLSGTDTGATGFDVYNNGDLSALGRSLAAGDVDGDGAKDLAMGGNETVVVQSSDLTTLWSFDGTGSTDFGAVVAIVEGDVMAVGAPATLDYSSQSNPAGAVELFVTSGGVGGDPVVDTTADDPDLSPGDGLCQTAAGECSLRAAIEEANASGGAAITFAIGGSSPWVIDVTSPLPAITSLVTIDGDSQLGNGDALATPGTRLGLRSQVAAADTDGLVFAAGADGSSIRGLAISGFTGSAITIEADGVTVRNMRLGIHTSDVGSVANQAGISIEGTNALVENNLISNNTNVGADVLAAGAVLRGNRIGTSIDGENARPNDIGVNIGVAAGLVELDDNVISGNAATGVQVKEGTIAITSNRIGVTPSGAALGNSDEGILIAPSAGDSVDGTVGGNPLDSANIIAHNGAEGVGLIGDTTVAVVGNSIHDNAGLGIDLGSDGVTPNDAGDGDTGPNGLLNAPAITDVTAVAGGFDVRVAHDTGGSYRLQLFANTACDPSGFGEGEIFVTSIDVDVTPGQSVVVPIATADLAGGTALTATLSSRVGFVVDATSEFSFCTPLAAPSDATVSNLTLTVDTAETGPGITAVPISDIPVDAVLAAASDTTEAAAPLSAVPLSAVDLGSTPLSAVPLSAVPLSAVPLSAVPLSAVPLSAVGVDVEGGWSELLVGTSQEGRPANSVDLGELLAEIPTLPPSHPLQGLTLADVDLGATPLSAVSTAAIMLGDLDLRGSLDVLCDDAASQGVTCDDTNNTLLGLELAGYDVSASPLSAVPLSAVPLSAVPLSAVPLSAVPLSAVPLSAVPLSAVQLEGTPLSAVPLSAVEFGAIPLSAVPLSAVPLSAVPLSAVDLAGSPLGATPLGQLSSDRGVGCEILDGFSDGTGPLDCDALGLDDDSTLHEAALALEVRSSLAASPLSAVPLSAVPLSAVPLSAVPLSAVPLSAVALADSPLSAVPLSAVSFDGSTGCEILLADAFDCTDLGLDDSATLLDVAEALLAESASLEDSRLADAPLSAVDFGAIPLSAVPLSAVPLSAVPLSAVDLAGTPLSAVPLSAVTFDGATGCDHLVGYESTIDGDLVALDCTSLGIDDSATLYDLAVLLEGAGTSLAASPLSAVPLSAVPLSAVDLGLTDATLETLFGEGTTLADLPESVLEQLDLLELLFILTLAQDYPWEELDLVDLGVQDFVPTATTVTYSAGFEVTGDGPATAVVELPRGYRYRATSSTFAGAPTLDPAITETDTGQILTWNLELADGTSPTLSFDVSPGFELVTSTSDATVHAANTLSVADQAPHTVTPEDGNDSVDADVLQIGYITGTTESDTYTVSTTAAGNTLSVFLGHQSSDVDLVMYRPTTAPPPGSDVPAPASTVTPYEDEGPASALVDGTETGSLGDVPNDPTASIVESSADRGVGTETTTDLDLEGGTSYQIEVSGYNENVSTEPYLLRVAERSEVPIPVCDPIAGRPASADLAPATVLPPGLESIVVFDLGRATALHGAAGAATMESAAQALVDELNALPAYGSAALFYTDSLTDYSAWDANPCDWRAADDVAKAIRSVLAQYQTDNESLDYVTIVGGDELIPFHRQVDATAYANEAAFASEYSSTMNPSLYGAFTTRHILTDHPYGDPDPVPWLDRWLYVPEVSVGRLVETPDEIAQAVATFTTYDGLLDASTAATVTGYDFLTDGAEQTAASLVQSGATPDTSLISETWTDDDLEAVLGTDPDGLLSINAHFDPWRALPAAEQLTGEADYNENVLFQTSDLFDVDLERTWLFTMGCHAGLSEADITLGRTDWAQSFSGSGGLFTGNTGFGYGDTVTVALSEEIVAGVAENLTPSYWTGTRTVGQAVVDSLNDYYGIAGLYGVYDEKALQQFTLYGPPMYRVETDPTTDGTERATLEVGFDPLLGLPAATTFVDDAPTPVDDPTRGTYYTVDGQTLDIHYRPIQPMTSLDVTIEGLTARGAIITGWTSTDVTVTDAAYFRPIIDDSSSEAEIEDDAALFPSVFATISAYERTSPVEGRRTEERQNLNLILGQYDAETDTQRLFTDVDVEIVYVDSDSLDQPGADVSPATISTVQAVIVDDQVTFIVDVDDATPASRVLVLYRPIGTATWASVDLQANSPWSGSAAVPAATEEVEYLVQVVRDNGTVATSSSKGEFFRAEPATTELPATGELTVTADGQQLGRWFTGDVVVDAEGTAGPFTATVDGEPADLPVTLDDSGAHVVVITDAEGNETTFVIPIDNAAPEAVIEMPSSVDQFADVSISTACRDSGSGLASCTVTVDGTAVPQGSLLDTSTPGTRQLAVTATDRVGNTTTATADVEVIGVVEPALVAEVSPTLVAVGDPVSVQASVTDGTVETWTVDWGDGTIESLVASTGDLSVAHAYAESGQRVVTVTATLVGGAELVADAGSVTVYDTDAHRLNGAGWFTSDAGSWTVDPTRSGHTTFALDLRYRDEDDLTPTGVFTMRFRRADLRFTATDWDWLLTDAGTRWEGGTAVAEGTGRIRHRDGDVHVRIEATDTGLGWRRDLDDLRIVLTDAETGEVLYDSATVEVRGAVVLSEQRRWGHHHGKGWSVGHDGYC